MVRVAFDTNIYISAFVFPGGKAESAYLEAIRGAFQLVTSVAILTEAATVLQDKFDWDEEEVRRAIHAISQTAMVLRTRLSLHVLRDEPDNRIVECAVEARAKWIVTGDRHLLALQQSESVDIVTLPEFLQHLHLAQ